MGGYRPNCESQSRCLSWKMNAFQSTGSMVCMQMVMSRTDQMVGSSHLLYSFPTTLSFDSA